MTRSDIPYYLDYLPRPLLDELDASYVDVDGVAGLRADPELLDAFGHLETPPALAFTVALYEDVVDHLNRVLSQRSIDRAFLDAEVADAVEQNTDVDFQSTDYRTPIGKRDEVGRIVLGPRPYAPAPTPIEIPEFMQGEQVTLFGPPDNPKLSINAMNAVHRKPADEPEIIARLVDDSGQVPRWGADNEDSKTPIMRNFLHACENLIGCFDGTLSFHDERRGKTYELADERLSKPIKRIPGLALPDGSHIYQGNPLPLHLYDFAMHMFHNWDKREALVFYVPKLENEEEAAYLRTLIEVAEGRLAELHPEYEAGTVRLFIVFENPRAIFRIREIAETLHPFFLGGSLGWHDFLGSTARLFKNDPRYRIPVKADPNIVINHIKESHEILVRALGESGAITIGGMYGVLYEDGNPASHEVSMVGYIKDVVTQLKRGLDGFWVAHPDFVRPGIALVRAYRELEAGDDSALQELVSALVPNATERDPLLEFVFGPDVDGLDEDDPQYARGVLAADVETSDVISNDDPREVRYNIFQALQYLADWLCGNGCVALPAMMTNASGDDVFVRVMDDLATTERSRWELWAEVHHGRVAVSDFDAMLDDEYAFIVAGESTDTKRVQVAHSGDAARWYPIAKKLLRQLVVTDNPPEFATELLMPFTFERIRGSEDPWGAANELCAGHFE